MLLDIPTVQTQLVALQIWYLLEGNYRVYRLFPSHGWSIHSSLQMLQQSSLYAANETSVTFFYEDRELYQVPGECYRATGGRSPQGTNSTLLAPCSRSWCISRATGRVAWSRGWCPWRSCCYMSNRATIAWTGRGKKMGTTQVAPEVPSPRSSTFQARMCGAQHL